MSSPLDKIFEEAVNNCYSDFRWLIHTSDDKGRIFNISDFIKCFRRHLKISGTQVRPKTLEEPVMWLNSLVSLFDNQHRSCRGLIEQANNN